MSTSDSSCKNYHCTLVVLTSNSIYKMGQKEDQGNYKPVSQTLVPVKFMEPSHGMYRTTRC